MVIFTDGWVVLVGSARVRTGAKGNETVAVCEASLETNAYKERGSSFNFICGLAASFTVPWEVLCEPVPRHSIIAALKRQPEWKAWEKRRLQGKV